MSKNQKIDKSIVKQLRGVFVLGVIFLIISLLVFESLNQKTFNAVSEAHHLDGGIIAVNLLRESINRLDETLSAAELAHESKDVDGLFEKQYQEILISVQSLFRDFKKYSHVEKYFNEVAKSLDEINVIAQSILNNKSDAKSLSAKIFSVKQHQLEIDESLAKTAIEFRSLLDSIYSKLQKEKNEPIILGLVLTLIFVLILSFLSSQIFRRIRHFIANHLLATQKISHGDLEIRVPILQKDELGKISYEFNKMVSQLQSVKKELERSNSDLEDFAYTASHDLQTPLKHIAAFSEMIAQGKYSASSEQLSSWSENIKISTQNVIRLIDDLLRFSKVGKEGLDKEEICGNELVNQVIAQNSQSKIHLDPLPRFKGYRSLLYLVFQNLIDNAVKYCPKDRLPEIKISSELKNDHILIMISDNGLGIEDSQKERVFGLFKRLHSEEEVEGNGAGLAICRKIIERHEGKIWVEDNKNQGSVFCFTLPL